MPEFYSGDDFYVQENGYGEDLKDMPIDEAIDEVSVRANIEELDKLKNGNHVNTPLMREVEELG